MHKYSSGILAFTLTLVAFLGAPGLAQIDDQGRGVGCASNARLIAQADEESSSAKKEEASDAKETDAEASASTASESADDDGSDDQPKKKKKKKKKREPFNYDNATNIDDMPASQADEAESLRAFRGTVKEEPKKSLEELQQIRQKAVFDAGLKGAMQGVVWGFYGCIAVLVAFGIGSVAMKRSSAEMSASRGGPASVGNSKNSMIIAIGGCVISLIIGISAGVMPMVNQEMDKQKQVFHEAIKEKPPLTFKPVYSKIFGMQGNMAEPFRKIKIKFPPQQIGLLSTTGGSVDSRDERSLEKLPLEYWVLVYEDQKNGMALGWAKLPPLPKAEDSSYVTVFDVERGLDNTVKGICDSLNGKSTYSCPIALNNKVPGREADGHLDEGLKDSGKFRQRNYITKDGYYYSMVVWGDPKFVDSNTSYGFFDALELPREESKAAELEKKTAKEEYVAPSEDSANKFFESATKAIQEKLGDPSESKDDAGNSYVIKMLGGISPEGKITKLELKNSPDELIPEALQNKLFSAVTDASPFPEPPEFQGKEFIFKIKIIDNKVQVYDRSKSSKKLTEPAAEKSETSDSEKKPAKSEASDE